MRGWGVSRTVAGLAVGVGAVVSGGTSPAAALEPVRTGWWSELSAAPSPPDVPDDGIHVAGGPGGPSAIAALVFELPADTVPTSLTLTLAGASPMASGLQACVIPAEAAGFEPVQNGAWDDRPEHDCELGASPATVDGERVTFDLGSFAQGGVLAVALVPGATDRASMEHPGSDALQFAPGATSGGSSTESDPADTGPADSGPYAPGTFTPGAPPEISPSFDAPPTPASAAAPATTPEEVAFDAPSSAPAFAATVASEDGEPSGRTRVGGAIGFGLLLVALLFYSQGRGLLGARVGGVT